MRFLIFHTFLFVLTLIFSPPSIADSIAIHQMAPGSDSPPPSIKSLNGEFRAVYSHAKKEVIAHLDPVIVCEGTKVILLHDGKRIQEDYIPPNYSLLKTVDHAPLAVFVFLHDKTDRTLTADELKELLTFKILIQNAIPALQPSGLPESIITRQNQVLNKVLAFIDSVSSQQQVGLTQLNDFSHGLGKLALATAYDDVSLELASLDKIVRKWKSGMSKEAWSKLRVVITGGHMARNQGRTMQYFSRILKQKAEGDRLVYFEGSDDESKALDLLATHVLDRQAAKAFFHDPWRLHRDLLSDGAKRYLQEHSVP